MIQAPKVRPPDESSSNTRGTEDTEGDGAVFCPVRKILQRALVLGMLSLPGQDDNSTFRTAREGLLERERSLEESNQKQSGRPHVAVNA